jgi:hypothetical protein
MSDVMIFLRSQWVYLAHILALVRPGAEVPNVRAHQIQAQPLTGWPATSSK